MTLTRNWNHEKAIVSRDDLSRILRSDSFAPKRKVREMNKPEIKRKAKIEERRGKERTVVEEKRGLYRVPGAPRQIKSAKLFKFPATCRILASNADILQQEISSREGCINGGFVNRARAGRHANSNSRETARFRCRSKKL